MRKRIPASLTILLLALPGGALLAAGQVAQQSSPLDFNKELVTTILNFVGAILLVGLPVATQQILKLRSEIKTTKTEVQTTKDNAPTAEDMEKIQKEISLLQTSVQTLKDDLRVTALERDNALRERDGLKVENTALMKQNEEQRLQHEREYNDLKAKVDHLEEWKANRESIDQSIEKFANKIYAGMEKLITLAKMSTSERQAVELKDLKST